MADFRSCRACKPNFVCRRSGMTVIPLGRALLRGSSDLPGGLAHRASTRPPSPQNLPCILPKILPRRRNFLPIWSCSVWGLPCPPDYPCGGALLPHLFTLTAALPPRRYVFCGTFRPPDLNPASRTLSGTLLCGVRTFLPAHSRQSCLLTGSRQNERGGRPVRLPTSSL